MIPNVAPQKQIPDPHVTTLALAKLAERVRSGAGWLNAVAVFSAINSLINAFDGGRYFLVGLGITQLIDAFGSVFAQEMPNMATTIKFVAVAISLGISGILGVLGYFSRRGHAWAFTLAGVGYTVDTLIVLYFQDYGGIIFHLIALFFMGSGALAALKLQGSDALEWIG